MANESNIRSGFNSRGNSDVLGQFTVTGGGASVPMLITGATDTLLELRDQSSGDVLSLFKADGTELFKVSTTGITVGGSYTLPLADGTSGQALTTDGAGAMTFNTVLSSGDNISVLTNDSGYIANITAESIGSLSDVTLTSTQVGSILVQQSDASFLKLGAGTWANGYIDLDDLKDVTSGAVNNDLLIYNGTNWVPDSLALADLSNVDGSLNVGSNPQIGNVIRYDGTDFGFGGGQVSYTTYNATPSTISYGAVVKQNGVNTGIVEDYFTAGTATSNTDTIIGLAIREMTTGDPYGAVMENGIVGNIDTSGYSVNDKLYVSTSGTLTNTPPTTGPVIYIGRVLSSAVGGTVHVQVEQNNAGGVVTNATYEEGESVIWDGDAFVNGNPSVLIDVYNDSGAQINKGEAVYISGEHASGKPTIAKAANGSSSTMPAAGLLQADIADGAEGKLVVSGALGSLDTSAFSAGDALYVDSTAGALTSTRPTATSALVQKVGIVTRDHASSGEILIMGANRTNDIPNDIELDDLSDANIVSPATGHVLTYNGVTSVWTNQVPSDPTLAAVTAAGASTTDTITAGSYVTTGNVTAIGTGNNTFTGNLNGSGGFTALDNTLSKAFSATSTDNTAVDWTAVEIYRNSSSPAADDILGSVVFNGEDSANTKLVYGAVSGVITDENAISSAGAVVLKYGDTGTLVDGLKVSADGVEIDSAYILPMTSGTSGQILKYPSSGSTLEWGDASSGGNPHYNFDETCYNVVSTGEDNYYWYPGSSVYGFDGDTSTSKESATLSDTGTWNRWKKMSHRLPSGTYDLDFLIDLSISTLSSGTTHASDAAGDTTTYYVYKVKRNGTNGDTTRTQIATGSIVQDATDTAVGTEVSFSTSGTAFDGEERILIILQHSGTFSGSRYAHWCYDIQAEKTA